MSVAMHVCSLHRNCLRVARTLTPHGSTVDIVSSAVLLLLSVHVVSCLHVAIVTSYSTACVGLHHRSQSGTHLNA